MAWVPLFHLTILVCYFNVLHLTIFQLLWVVSSDTTEIIEYFRNNTFSLMSNMTIIGTYFRQLGISVKALKRIIFI